MPIDYPPELICTASCNNPECTVQVRVECQHGDFQADVAMKLRRKGWIVDGDAVYCSQRCLALDPVTPEVAGLLRSAEEAALVVEKLAPLWRVRSNGA